MTDRDRTDQSVFASCAIVFVEDEWQQEGMRSRITEETSNFL